MYLVEVKYEEEVEEAEEECEEEVEEEKKEYENKVEEKEVECEDKRCRRRPWLTKRFWKEKRGSTGGWCGGGRILVKTRKFIVYVS